MRWTRPGSPLNMIIWPLTGSTATFSCRSMKPALQAPLAMMTFGAASVCAGVLTPSITPAVITSSVTGVCSL